MSTTDRPDGGHAEHQPKFCAACAAPLQGARDTCPSCGARVVGIPAAAARATDAQTADVQNDGTRDRDADAESAADVQGEVAVGSDTDADADLAATDDDAHDTQEVPVVRPSRPAVGSEPQALTAVATAVAVAPAAEGQVVCRACNVTNSSARLLCGSCGVDLDTGETGLAVEPLTTDDVAGSPSTRRAYGAGGAWRGIVFAIIAVLVVVGIIIGVLAVLGAGPFASDEDPQVPQIAFSAERYTDEPERLRLTDVATLTMRAPDGERTFTPEQMVDGDPLSSWHQDAAALPAETAEKIDLFFDGPAWITGIVFANGDHLEPDAYAEAARMQRIELHFDGDDRVAATLLDQGLEPQIVELSEPLLSTALRIEVLSSVPGLEREDVALSGVVVLGHVAEGEDIDAAVERAEVQPATGAIALPRS